MILNFEFLFLSCSALIISNERHIANQHEESDQCRRVRQPLLGS